MGTKVKITYDSASKQVKIQSGEKLFDTSKIDGKEITDWAYPFSIKGVKWNGIYAELADFLGEKEFQVQFDGDEHSLNVLKDSMRTAPVKIAGMNNKVIILYKKEPLSTIITVNGKAFDTSKLQNRYIDEWISSFQFRDAKWDGIFAELENFIGTDQYAIQFCGDQDDMKELMKSCPDTVDLTYRSPTAPVLEMTSVKKSKKQRPETTAVSSDSSNISHMQTDYDPIALQQLKGSLNAENLSGNLNKVKTQFRTEVSDEQVQQNLRHIPIKNDFVRNNILTICSVVCILILLLPFVVISTKSSYSDTSITFNGVQTLLGGDGLDGCLFSAVFLLGPILLVIMNYIQKLKPYRRLISILIPGLCIISEFASWIYLGMEANSVQKSANAGLEAFGESMKVNTIPHIGFFLLLLAYIITAVVGFLTYYGLELPAKKK